MATTITSYPSALSLAGNIAPVRVAASDTFRFKLSKGSSVLLEEDYTPDASGYAEIDIRDIVLSDLYLALPSSDVFCQSAAAASYTISAGVDSKTFTGVLCGVDRPATDAATFLLTNFLTWQPQIKAVQYNQPEWLSFFVSSAQTSLKVRFYKKDGTTADVVVADSRSFDPNRVYSVNMQFARIWALGDGDRYGMFDAWLEDDQGTKLTYTQRYVLDTSSDDRTLFVTRNSLGGLDTFVLHGSVELASEAEHTNVMRARLLAAGTIDGSRTYSVNTGLLSLHEAKWMQDLLRSQQSWVLLDGALRSIVLLSPSVTSSSIDDSSGTVDFMLCDDDGYLNIARTDVAPEAIEVPGPDGGEVFFLAPRLIEYPDASLEDSWLIPLQSVFEEKWYKASLGGIRSYVAGYLEDTYGRLWHGHDNLAVLDKFGIDASGALTWNGNPVESGTNAGDFVTLATEQTITGKKTFSADAVFATKLYVPSTAGAGVYDVFIDDNGAVSGETPSAGGEGLDIDAMWSELAADDASRAIHISHIPLIPWGNVSGKPTTLQGYGLLTEADNRYVRLVDGMGLSSNDYTDGEKEKLSGIAVGAQVNVLESVKLNGSILQVTSKAVNVNAVTSLSVPTGLSAGDMTSAGKISVSLASGYVIPKNTAKFWGRTWNGLDDVSGAIEGATDIDASGTVYAATAIRTNKLYVPSTSGNNVYDIYVDDSGAVSGEVPAAGEGLDIDAMWEELASDDASRVIDLSHIPMIPWGNVSGIPSTFTPSAHNQAWSTITDTPSTLEGYGITDAYSKTDADERYLLKSAYTASDVLAKLLTVDGTGSKLDADLLDGTHKADLFSALSSNATTNLSVTIGGTTKSIADLYATYADKLRTARTLWGQSFKGDANVSGDMTGVGSIDASGTVYAATAIRTNKLYVPSTSGNNVYDIYVDDSGTVSGEAPAAGEGLDIDAMWEELATDDASRVINLSHIPLIPWGNVSGIPSTFTPSSHSHKKSDISDFPTLWAWSAISGKPDTFTPSDHYQAWSTITDTPSTLAGYGITDAYSKTDADERYLLKSAYTASDVLAKLLTVDGTGSELDADLLDGTHKADLFSALSSNVTTNLSVTIGGTTKSIADLYATYADKLRTARTLWGQSFDGTANVSGNLSSVGTINSTSFNLGGGQLLLYNSSSKNYRLTQNYDGSVARIYNINADGVGYQDLSLGQTQTNAGALYFDASALMWGLGTTTPAYKLDIVGTFRATGIMKANGGFVTTKLYIPASAGNQVYDLYIDDTGTVSGEAPAAGEGGIDIDAMWEELAADDASRTIHLSHIPSIPTSRITGLDTVLAPYATQAWVRQQGYLASVPKATSSAYGGIKIGYPESGKNYPVELDSSGRAYVSVPWVNTTYSLSSFGITATAAEINKLDGIGTLLHSGNYTSYTVTKTGGGASGTWGISISGNAATADISNYLFLHPNNGTHASQDNAVPANGRFAIYDVDTTTTAGGEDGYIMSFRWPSGNWCTQLYLDVDSTGIMALRHRNSSSVWTDWYRILHTGNYSSYLDSRYVKKSGDTMSGDLTMTGHQLIWSDYVADWNSFSDGLRVIRSGVTATGAPGSYYVGLNVAHLDYKFQLATYGGGGSDILFRNYNANEQSWTGWSKIWNSNNDGSGSGLDADLLDGQHASYIQRHATGFDFKNNFDLNIDYSSGSVSYNYSSAASWINAPQGMSYGMVLPIMAESGYSIAAQIAFDIVHGSTEATGNMWFRCRNTTQWGTNWKKVVTDSDIGYYNAGSATKLQIARTLWGQSFDGTENVSGAISSTGSITPSAGGSYNIGTSSLWYGRIYGRYIDTASGYNLRLCTGGTEHLSIAASNGYVGINNTSPAYQLDVTGKGRFSSTLLALAGVQIGGASDYGWYIHNSRLAAGINVARGVNVGSLLISSAWADYTKVPSNGIYCKGSILIGGTITGEQNVIAYSSSSRALKDIVWHSSYSEKLQSLGRVVDYRYNDILKRDKEIHTGLIYESVKPVIPSMCYMYEGYGALNYLSPDYINLIAGAVQEHTSELTTLRNKVRALEDEISRLRRGLAA